MLITSVVDPGEKLIAGVLDTGAHFVAGDTGEIFFMLWPSLKHPFSHAQFL